MKKLLINFFTRPSQHVRLSENAREILSDRKLANELVDAITNNRKALNIGEKIKTKSGMKISFV